MDIRQTEVPARVAIGELLVINPELVEDGGVQVVEMNPVLPRVVSAVSYTHLTLPTICSV